MFRFATSAALFIFVLLAAGCGESLSDTGIVSQAFAAPAPMAPDYGWRTSMSPTAVDGNIADYY
jgi:hypothetical protein